MEVYYVYSWGAVPETSQSGDFLTARSMLGMESAAHARTFAAFLRLTAARGSGVSLIRVLSVGRVCRALPRPH